MQAGFRRMMLHAQGIIFPLAEGKQLQVRAPIPRDFSETITALSGGAGQK
jgi:hypothetical protein